MTAAEPITIEFDVAAPPERAFQTWTAHTALWWPRTHTVSGAEGVDVVFERWVGGRIYERAPDGAEHDWGEVVVWDPPHRVGCLWHLFFDRSEATDLEISFRPVESGTTVTIRQSGFERLGDSGTARRANTHNAWAAITPLFSEAV